MVIAPSIDEAIRILFKPYINRVILSHETAAALLGMVSEDGYPLIFYTDLPNSTNSSYVSGVYTPNLNTEGVVQVRGVLCTNKERTICELIKDDKDNQAILEALNYYLENHENTTNLFIYAEKYNITENLKTCITEALDYYVED